MIIHMFAAECQEVFKYSFGIFGITCFLTGLTLVKNIFGLGIVVKYGLLWNYISFFCFFKLIGSLFRPVQHLVSTTSPVEHIIFRFAGQFSFAQIFGIKV